MVSLGVLVLVGFLSYIVGMLVGYRENAKEAYELGWEESRKYYTDTRRKLI